MLFCGGPRPPCGTTRRHWRWDGLTTQVNLGRTRDIDRVTRDGRHRDTDTRDVDIWTRAGPPRSIYGHDPFSMRPCTSPGPLPHVLTSSRPPSSSPPLSRRSGQDRVPKLPWQPPQDHSPDTQTDIHITLCTSHCGAEVILHTSPRGAYVTLYTGPSPGGAVSGSSRRVQQDDAAQGF